MTFYTVSAFDLTIHRGKRFFKFLRILCEVQVYPLETPEKIW